VSQLRVAAVGDLHASDEHREHLERAFASLEDVDLVLLAGDLTTHGLVDEAGVLASACERARAPVAAVLGNHDHHSGLQDEIGAVLERSGVVVLDGGHVVLELAGMQVGVVGAKGFVGGFPGSALPDFGEALLRQVYAETTCEAEAIARGLQEIVHCDLRVVLLHYAPVEATIAGEPEGIHVMLGSDRLATPIAEYGADLVLHGHAHAGTFKGCIGKIPVYNVAVHVTGRDFWIFDLEGAKGRSATRVEGPA